MATALGRDMGGAPQGGNAPTSVYDRLLDDVRAEYVELDTFVSGLPDRYWQERTAFFDWTVRDQILHVYQVDRFGLTSLRGADEFAAVKAVAREGQAQGIELSEQIRREIGKAPRKTILEAWRETYQAVLSSLAARDAKSRMTWFGPDMGLMSFASSRLMEVWAHGQDIYDLLEVNRPAHERIRHICDIGVRTFGWSFTNRGLEVPVRPPVTLQAPSGASWEWPGDGAGAVRGDARDFALVVTQRRAPGDTALVAEGAVAARWLDIAQCFAGAPQEPAAPGSRPALSPAAMSQGY